MIMRPRWNNGEKKGYSIDIGRTEKAKRRESREKNERVRDEAVQYSMGEPCPNQGILSLSNSFTSLSFSSATKRQLIAVCLHA